MTKSKFIHVPLDWLQKVMKIERNVNVTKLALYIWYQFSITKSNPIAISSGKAEKMFSVCQKSFPKALRTLEAVGVVSVVWHKNRSPLVTVILEDLGDCLIKDVEFEETIISPTGEKQTIKCKLVKN